MRKGITITILSFLLASLLSAQNQVEQTRDVIRKWVETRQLISKEKSDWAAQKEILQETRTLLQQQLADLQKKLEDAESGTTEIDKEILQLQNEKASYVSADEEISKALGNVEKRVLDLIKSFPPVLRSALNQPIARIPQDEEKAKGMTPGERMLNILAIIGQAERFNSTVTLAGETRAVNGGDERQVSTLYWGLSLGMYVDKQKQNAGIGYPTVDGWEWEPRNDLAPSIAQIVAVYEGTADPAFIEIPFEIK